MSRNFEQEQEEARDMTEQIRAALARVGFDPESVSADWQRSGRLAYVLIGGREVGDLIELHNQPDEDMLSLVRTRLLELMAREVRQTRAAAMRWTLLQKPEDAPAQCLSVWRVHFDDDTIRGVNVAEYVDEQGRRSFGLFAGGPEPGAHQLYIDKLSVQALQLIKQSGGTVEYRPEAERADNVKGRRWVTLPEGTIMDGPDEFMAAQKYRLPGGAELVIQPHWYTVDMWALGEPR